MTDTSPQFLPPNASQLQRDLDKAIGPSVAAIEGVDAIPGIKYSPPDNMLPWLVWEYGLEGLLPYLTDPRLAIQEGVQWQRIRGTPASLNMALGWLDLHDTKIEPEVPGEHFYEYQIDSGQIVPSDMLDNLKAVASFSAPLRSRLTRLYHDYDVRRLLLDESEYGAMLSDYSGVKKNGLVLSFARQHNSGIINDQIQVNDGALIHHTAHAKDIHWPTLDDDLLGGPQTGSTRFALRSSNAEPTSHIWVGNWDTRTWNDSNYLFVGSSHSNA